MKKENKRLQCGSRSIFMMGVCAIVVICIMVLAGVIAWKCYSHYQGGIRNAAITTQQDDATVSPEIQEKKEDINFEKKVLTQGELIDVPWDASIIAGIDENIYYFVDIQKVNAENEDSAIQELYRYNVSNKSREIIARIDNFTYSSGDVLVENDSIYYSSYDEEKRMSFLYKIGFNKKLEKREIKANFPLVGLAQTDKYIYELKRVEEENGDMSYIVVKLDNEMKQEEEIDCGMYNNHEKISIVDIYGCGNKLYELLSQEDGYSIKVYDEETRESKTYFLECEDFLDLSLWGLEEEENDYFLNMWVVDDVIALETSQARIAFYRFEQDKLCLMDVTKELCDTDGGSRIISTLPNQDKMLFSSFIGNLIYTYETEKNNFIKYEISLPENEEIVGRCGVSKEGLFIQTMDDKTLCKWYYFRL